MGEGLNVGLDQFNKMSSKDRDSVMFQNIVHLRVKTRSDQLNKKIQYFWLVGLSLLMGAKRMFGL